MIASEPTGSASFLQGDYYLSLVFYAYLAGAVLLFRLLPLAGGPRQLLLLLCNAAMLLSLPGLTAGMLLAMLLLAAVSYGCGRVSMARAAGRGGSAATWAGVLGTLMILCYYKYPTLQTTLDGLLGVDEPGVAALIGASYSSFRAMSFVVECHKGTIRVAGPAAYLNYLFFFPSLVSGPIARFTPFQSSCASAGRNGLGNDVLQGLTRMVHGLFKKVVLAGIAWGFTPKGSGIALDQFDTWSLLGAMYAYGLFIYFDFSGYTDLAIGAGRLLGYQLPENFNNPLLKRNIQQLWANWHMSLTSWLTDYIYWPIANRCRKSERLRPHPVLISNLAILVTFLACGVWHGETWGFVLWGLYHGIGIAVVNTLNIYKRRVRNKKVLMFLASRTCLRLSIALTFTFFAIGLLPFALNGDEVAALLAGMSRP